MSGVRYYRKRYLELLRMLSDERKPEESYGHILDQLEGVERELYRLGQYGWMEKTVKRHLRLS